MHDSWLVILMILAVTTITWFVYIRLRRREFTVVQLLLWYAAKVLVRGLWGTRYSGRWPIPKGQGAVVICNHRSSVDPFFIQAIADRPMRWMVAREYVGNGLMGWFLKTVNVIPVGRNGVDTAATKAAIRWASDREVVGMLPEGRINTTEDVMLSVRPGAIVVALNSRVPILPCYIDGAPYGGTATSPFFMRARVRIIFGKLIDISEHCGKEGDSAFVADLALRIVHEIAILAGRPDFQPKLAGRRWKPTPEELGEAPTGDTLPKPPTEAKEPG